MNRRTFLTGTPVAVTLATTLATGAPPVDRKKVLIPPWEPERVEDLRSAVPQIELVVANDSLEQIHDADAAFGFIDRAHVQRGRNSAGSSRAARGWKGW